MKKSDKRAVSIMIGYILLITFAVVISAVVFQWLKTYVPKQGLECPEDVSLYVSEYTFDNETGQLNLTLVNNGKFSIDGIFIYYSDNSSQEIATKPIADKIEFGAGPLGAGLNFPRSLEPSKSKPLTFDLSGLAGQTIYAIEITPMRQQEVKKRPQTVSCTNAKTKKILDLDIEAGSILDTPPGFTPVNYTKINA